MENFRAPFLKLDYIYSTADNFRKKYSNEILPVDVLKIVEQKLRINIYPIKNLKKDTDIDALISKDFTFEFRFSFSNPLRKRINKKYIVGL